mmetsp:Transcript_33757/g.47112  ORF Transcript_33757/g.47112 Transcript_33757/m.47112 type:complete len:83 (-) Transcript_33757:340-588(-)
MFGKILQEFYDNWETESKCGMLKFLFRNEIKPCLQSSTVAPAPQKVLFLTSMTKSRMSLLSEISFMLGLTVPYSERSVHLSM